MEWKFSKPVSIPLRIIIISCSAYFIFKAFHLLSNDPEVLGKYTDFIFTGEDRTGGIPENEMRVAMETGGSIDELGQ